MVVGDAVEVAVGFITSGVGGIGVIVGVVVFAGTQEINDNKLKTMIPR